MAGMPFCSQKGIRCQVSLQSRGHRLEMMLTSQTRLSTETVTHQGMKCDPTGVKQSEERRNLLKIKEMIQVCRNGRVVRGQERSKSA